MCGIYDGIPSPIKIILYYMYTLHNLLVILSVGVNLGMDELAKKIRITPRDSLHFPATNQAHFCWSDFFSYHYFI